MSGKKHSEYPTFFRWVVEQFAGDSTGLEPIRREMQWHEADLFRRQFYRYAGALRRDARNGDEIADTLSRIIRDLSVKVQPSSPPEKDVGAVLSICLAPHAKLQRTEHDSSVLHQTQKKVSLNLDDTPDEWGQPEPGGD